MKLKTQKNSIGKNVIHLFYSTVFSSMLNALALIVLANYLESRSYGMLSVALAFAMIMGYFTDSGLSDIVLREGSKKNADVSRVISSYIKMRMGLLIATFLFGFMVIHLANDNLELIKTMYYLIIPMVSGIAMQSIGTTYFQLTEKMQYYGLIRMLSAVFLMVTISVGMLLSLHPFIISFLYGFSYFLAGAIGVLMTVKRIEFDLKGTFHKGLLNGLPSFLISGLLFVILPQLGPIVLEKTVTLREVGFFAVAYRIPQALNQLPNVVAGAFYPVLFRLHNSQEKIRHLELNLLQVKIMALMGMAFTIPLFHMSDFVITLLFGEEWLFASKPLQILSIMLTLQSISIALADGLTSKGLQHFRTIIQTAAVTGGGLLYYFFSKSNGIMGAAYAGIAIETFALLGFWVMNPARFKIAARVLAPYLLYCGTSLLGVHFLLERYSVAAVIVNMLLLAVVVFIDKSLRTKVMLQLESVKAILVQRHERKMGRVEDGL